MHHAFINALRLNIVHILRLVRAFHSQVHTRKSSRTRTTTRTATSTCTRRSRTSTTSTPRTSSELCCKRCSLLVFLVQFGVLVAERACVQLQPLAACGGRVFINPVRAANPRQNTAADHDSGTSQRRAHWSMFTTDATTRLGRRFKCACWMPLEHASAQVSPAACIVQSGRDAAIDLWPDDKPYRSLGKCQRRVAVDRQHFMVWAGVWVQYVYAIVSVVSTHAAV